MLFFSNNLNTKKNHIPNSRTSSAKGRLSSSSEEISAGSEDKKMKLYTKEIIRV